MSLLVFSALALISCAAAQSDLCATYGGVCSYNRCSRYYVSSTSYQLCGNAYQRCCVAEVCLTQFGGNCQNSYSSCAGARYTHYGTKPLCERANDVCCITNTPAASTTTTPPPAQPDNPVADQDRCEKVGGKCQNQNYACSNGEYKLLGSSNEVLCDGWLTKDERCCIPDQIASTTPKPVTATPSTNTGSSPNDASGSQPGCGVQKVSLVNKRIIGGETAEKGEWPWQVSIIKSSSYLGRTYSPSCGGTLIAPQWVLSAAHCFTDVTSAYSLRVRIGEHSFYVDEGTESDGIVADIIRHPQYAHSQNKNDIALIKLTKPVDINSRYIGVACLPQRTDMRYFYQTDECFSTGWGNTRGTSGDSNILQEVQSSLVSQAKCYSKWGYKIDSTKVCFGDGSKGACVGDSGGPLVCKKNGVFNLVGVVSYGSKSCTDSFVPTVYTNVAAYNTWIKNTMANN